MMRMSGDNRDDSAHTSAISPDRSAASLNLQSGCRPYARTDHNQRPAVTQILLQRSIA